MTEKARAAQRAYRKEWARRNPDKVKAQQERYWQRRAERMAQEAAQERQTEQAEGQA